MRKIMLLVGAIGVVQWIVRRQRSSGQVDLTHAVPDRPQAPIEQIESQIDVPGGVRP
jgi:hypothetical protein